MEDNQFLCVALLQIVNNLLVFLRIGIVFAHVHEIVNEPIMSEFIRNNLNSYLKPIICSLEISNVFVLLEIGKLALIH